MLTARATRAGGPDPRLTNVSHLQGGPFQLTGPYLPFCPSILLPFYYRSLSSPDGLLVGHPATSKLDLFEDHKRSPIRSARTQSNGRDDGVHRAPSATAAATTIESPRPLSAAD